ncbi:MAG: hypothetical protein CFE46_12080 [Burkholderiales bacterium PBB6]|jgi:hypothetical protein|nr:MAG: hypothetical protein CFE46_12080 [Burkholderiales bacterium PBB6]
MPADTDPEFYSRADAHINLSNGQISKSTRGKVSASMLFGTTRFNAWLSATGFDSAEEMRQGREDTIKFFVAEYEKMLAENLDDYIQNFDRYMKPAK